MNTWNLAIWHSLVDLFGEQCLHSILEYISVTTLQDGNEFENVRTENHQKMKKHQPIQLKLEAHRLLKRYSNKF